MDTQQSSVLAEHLLDPVLDSPTKRKASKAKREFEKLNREIWNTYKQQIFEGGIPKQTEWKGLHEIVRILKIIAGYTDCNYMFMPEVGGDEIDSVKYSNTPGCINLYSCGFYKKIKPVRLVFEFLDNEFEYSYFRLETEMFSKKHQSGVFILVKKASAFNNHFYDTGFHNKMSARELKKAVSIFRKEHESNHPYNVRCIKKDQKSLSLMSLQ